MNDLEEHENTRRAVQQRAVGILEGRLGNAAEVKASLAGSRRLSFAGAVRTTSLLNALGRKPGADPATGQHGPGSPSNHRLKRAGTMSSLMAAKGVEDRNRVVEQVKRAEALTAGRHAAHAEQPPEAQAATREQQQSEAKPSKSAKAPGTPNYFTVLEHVLAAANNLRPGTHNGGASRAGSPTHPPRSAPDAPTSLHPTASSNPSSHLSASPTATQAHPSIQPSIGAGGATHHPLSQLKLLAHHDVDTEPDPGLDLEFELGDDVENFEEEVVSAVSDFNFRHSRFSGTARETLSTFTEPSGEAQTSFGSKVKFRASLNDVRRNRLFVHETYDPYITPILAKPPKVQKRKKWRLEDSIWAPRKTTSNSKDFFEDREAVKRMFDLDWGHASQTHGFEKAIQSADARALGAGALARFDDDGDGIFDAVESTMEALWHHHHLIYGAFDYYAALMEGKRDSHGEVAIWSISYK